MVGKQSQNKVKTTVVKTKTTAKSFGNKLEIAGTTLNFEIIRGSFRCGALCWTWRDCPLHTLPPFEAKQNTATLQRKL